MAPNEPNGDPGKRFCGQVASFKGSAGSALELPAVDSNAIIERFSAGHYRHDAILAFDADGTLWSGDVSDDVFLHACNDGWLLEAARPALSNLAGILGLETSGSASHLSLELFESHKLGLIGEVQLYAMMSWCYAGHTLKELADYAEHVLQLEDLAARIRPQLSQIIDWAMRRNIRCYVVSASPTPIVCLAAAWLGFSPDRVIGTKPKTRNGIIEPEISDDVPFGANKCKLLRRLSGDSAWMACFGDSEFDFEMLECADLAVAVSPKSSLIRKLLPLSHAVLLKTPD